MRLATLVAVLAAIMVALEPSAARAQSSSAELRAAGEWTGRYVCRQGVTGLRIVMQVNGDDVKGLAHFYPLPENRGVPEGCFTVTGRFDAANGTMTLEGERWIKRPRRYLMIKFEGNVDKDGVNFSGNLGGAPTCSIFVLTRAESSRPMPRECAAEALR